MVRNFLYNLYANTLVTFDHSYIVSFERDLLNIIHNGVTLFDILVENNLVQKEYFWYNIEKLDISSYHLYNVNRSSCVPFSNYFYYFLGKQYG